MKELIVVSGFLGAGKTTLIRKLIAEKPAVKTLVIQNEFGEVILDPAFCRAFQVTVREVRGGCICCSAGTDFGSILKEAAGNRPDRILIEPSGLSELSVIGKTLLESGFTAEGEYSLRLLTAADPARVRSYLRSHVPYYQNQLVSADEVWFMVRGQLPEAKLQEAERAVLDCGTKAAIQYYREE